MKLYDREKILNITNSALCTALLSVCSYLVIPLPFSAAVLSIHTFAVNVIALILSPACAGCTLLLYLVMGLMGLPVFSGGTAGPDKLFGPTGGYYFGFLIAVIIMSLVKGKKIDFRRYLLVTLLVGMPIQHICAVLFMCFHNGFNIAAVFFTISLPFLIGDAVKCVAASFCAVKLNSITSGFRN